MKQAELNPIARLAGVVLLPAVCLPLLSACATYESQPAPVAASASLAGPATLQTYRAVRASELIGKPVRSQQGEYMGDIADLVIQMGTGAVRYAIVTAGRADNLYALPVHAIKTGAANDIVMDFAKPRLADHRSWARSRWPNLDDIAYWNELDRISGFPPVQPGHGYDRFSELKGKLVVGARGEHVGRVTDLVINAASDAVHYAIVALDPGYAGGDRLVAVPLHGFMYPREGTNRLALGIDSTRLAELETFDAARWSELNDPRYVARIDRYFGTAFPPSAASLFEQLDTNRDGFLSRAELAPLQMAGSDRYVYVIRGGPGTASVFHAYDRDGDGFLNRTEAEAALRAAPGTTFARYDTNRDGFLSMAEAAPLLGLTDTASRAGVTFGELDRDRDGFVNRAEAAVLMPSTAAVATGRVAVQPVVSLQTYDMDRDGYLSRAEAAALLNAHGGASAFDRYDTNGDGFLSRAELDGLLQQQSVGGTGGQPGVGSVGGTR